jgi:hypothetical protein
MEDGSHLSHIIVVYGTYSSWRSLSKSLIGESSNSGGPQVSIPFNLGLVRLQFINIPVTPYELPSQEFCFCAANPQCKVSAQFNYHN